MSEEAKIRPADRSPRFPFIPLRKALERVETFQESARGHALPVARAIMIWNYAEKSSGGFQTIAALKLYGLLEDVRSGSARNVRISEAARKYFLDERPDHKEEARKQFALKPHIMGLLWEKWADDLPDDESARSILKVDQSFTESAANLFLSIYKDNLAFTGLGASDNISDINFDKDIGDSDMLKADLNPSNPSAQGGGVREERITDDHGNHIIIRFVGDSIEMFDYLAAYIEFRKTRLDKSKIKAEPQVAASSGDAAVPKGIPFVTTQQQKQRLKEMGFSEEQIRKMKPEEVHEQIGLKTSG